MHNGVKQWCANIINARYRKVEYGGEELIDEKAVLDSYRQTLNSYLIQITNEYGDIDKYFVDKYKVNEEFNKEYKTFLDFQRNLFHMSKFNGQEVRMELKDIENNKVLCEAVYSKEYIGEGWH